MIMDRYYIVTGDLHLERAQYGLPIRHQDNQQCIEAILREGCTNPKCLGVILTGDTFHRKSLLPKYQIQLQNIAQRLKKAGKTFLAIDGNHDGSDASWLDTRIMATAGCKTRRSRCGISFATTAGNALPEDQELPENTHCLFLHGRLLELMPWAVHVPEPEYDFSAEELRETGVKNCTVFLGNLHTYSDFHDPVGNNWFVYGGSTEMTEISEGNIVSDRFDGRYDPVKKYLRFYPGREHGKNWETVDLPNRPYLRRVISPEEDAELAVQSVDQWVENHPRGILALHYPEKLRANLKPHLPRWREKLLVFSEVPLSRGMAKPLHDMKESDILEIAQKELTERQLQLLAVVLTQNPFDQTLSGLLKLPEGPHETSPT
jgi:hypothetical protein